MPGVTGRWSISDFRVSDVVRFRLLKEGRRVEHQGRVEQLGREVLYVSIDGLDEVVIRPEQVIGHDRLTAGV